MSEYCRAELLYTGALAAFKLWGGDSLLARQYLRLGARNNPSILMRLLGKVTRPGRWSISTGAHNGSLTCRTYRS